MTYEEIYERYEGRVHSWVLRKVARPDADDLTQDIFLKVEKSLPKFRGECQISTWLYAITRQMIALYWRQATRVKFVRLPNTLPSTERCLDSRQYERQMVEKLAILSPARQEVMRRRINGDTLKQIASDTGLTPAAVKMNLYHSRKQLRRMLNGLS